MTIYHHIVREWNSTTTATAIAIVNNKRTTKHEHYKYQRNPTGIHDTRTKNEDERGDKTKMRKNNVLLWD